MVARDAGEATDSVAVGTVGEWGLRDGNGVPQLRPGIQQFATAPDWQVGHMDAPTATGTTHTFTVNWKAPAALVGDVKFYVASVVGASGSRRNTSGMKLHRSNRYRS